MVDTLLEDLELDTIKNIQLQKYIHITHVDNMFKKL